MRLLKTCLRRFQRVDKRPCQSHHIAARSGSVEEFHLPTGKPDCANKIDNGPDHSAAARAGSSLVIGTSPSFSNMAASAEAPALPVVSSLSPVKMLLAPARKQRAWALSDIDSRPAESRTIERGIRMRATAMVRTNSM